MGARSARRAAATADPLSSDPFGSHDLLGTEENGSFVGPWPPWKPNDGTSIHSASRATTDRTGRTEKSDGRLPPATLARSLAAMGSDANRNTSIITEHIRHTIQVLAKEPVASNSTPETMAPMVPPTISSEVIVPVTLPRSAMPNCLDAAIVGVMVPMHVPIPKLTAATMGPRSVAGKHKATQATMHATDPNTLPKRRPNRS